jgi:formate dehydrogenase subunit gamma
MRTPVGKLEGKPKGKPMQDRVKRNSAATRPMSARKLLGYFGIAVIVGAALAALVTVSATFSGPAYAQMFRSTPSSPPPASILKEEKQEGLIGNAAVPGNARPSLPRADLWRSVRQGVVGRSTSHGPEAGMLVQSEGENFRIVQNGPLPDWGGWLMLAMIVVLALFFAIRGRIRVEGGMSGRTVERFNVLERFAHWLTAISFILLALTGLNILYGRYFLKPIMGASVFATMTAWGKYTHDWIAFAFMAGLVLLFILWVANNLPTKADAEWLVQGGGMFSKGKHPPAYKFNAGQKILFWLIVLGGFSVSFSGVCLLMPFTLHPFAATFGFINLFGVHLPTHLTALEETQLALVWHAMMALLLITLILAHIYLGTLGMEGAFRSMTDGQVDENWAREHHALWLKRIKSRQQDAAGQPAE